MKKTYILLILLPCLLVFSSPALAQPKIGDALPFFSLSSPQDRSERDYLGILEGKAFSVNQIKADLVVIEIFSMYCPHCQQEAPNMNRLFGLVQADPKLRSRIKFIGIGAGNSPMEVNTFKTTYNVPFPLFPDENYQIHDLLGQVRTPYFITVKTRGGANTVIDSHLGAYDSPEQFLNNVLKPGLK